MAIDTAGYGGNRTTLNGGVRNREDFWVDWNARYPNTLSPANPARIGGSQFKSPIVDDVWIQHFPETARYARQTLVHHHLDCGPLAIPLPRDVHARTPGYAAILDRAAGSYAMRDIVGGWMTTCSEWSRGR